MSCSTIGIDPDARGGLAVWRDAVVAEHIDSNITHPGVISAVLIGLCAHLDRLSDSEVVEWFGWVHALEQQ